MTDPAQRRVPGWLIILIASVVIGAICFVIVKGPNL